ncbi:MAG: CocE/NonD family hydrolase [Haloarculaceae archaeon]
MRSGDIRHHSDLLIPVEGATVAATRYEPPGDDGPHPAVLVATPYRKDDWITYGSWHPSIEYLARSGYEVVVADVVGTGASTGEPTPFARDDGEHMASVVDWLADQPWTTGSVGMFGLSYGAWTGYATAAAAPDALGAIVPVSVAASGYASSYTGGVLNPLKRAVWATEFQARQALPPGRRDGDGRWARVWHDRLDRLASERPWLFRFLDHDLEDAFWDERRVDPEEVNVPTLAACGTRDVHTASMVPFVEALDVEKRLVVGPWRHRMPEQGRETAIDFRRQTVDWFDRYLRADDPDRERTSAPDLPPVAHWTERDGGWTVGAGTWRGRDRWPTVGTHPTRSFVLAEEGLELAPESDARDDGGDDGDGTGSVVRERAYDHTVGMESLERVGGVENPGVDTSADDARSMTAESGPLADPIEFTGTGVLVAHVSATTPTPVVGVRVVDVAPDDAARLVTSGRLAADHRIGHGPDDPEPLPDGPVGLEIPLTPTSHVFEPGHRVRLAVAAGHLPRALPRREQGRLRLHSAPGQRTALRFPGTVHEGGEGVPTFGDAVEMAPPDDRVPVRTPYTSGERGSWETARSHTEDGARFRVDGGKTVTRPDGTSLTWHREVTASVLADAPGTANFETRVEAELDHGHETVDVEAVGRVTRDVAHLETRVRVDGSTVFDEQWRR